MGLFESDYQRNVLTEMERNTRKLEELHGNVSSEKILELKGAIDFVKQAKLMKDMQVEIFQKRLQQIQYDKAHELFKKENSEEIVDGYSNPIEMARKFSSMEEMQAEISSKRAEIQSDKTENLQTQNKTVIKEEASERTH